MPSGVFFAGIALAGQLLDTGLVPAATVRTVTIRITTDDVPVDLQLYAGPTVTADRARRLEPKKLTIKPNSLYLLSGEVIGAGERVVVQASAECVVRITGFEEVA